MEPIISTQKLHCRTMMKSLSERTSDGDKIKPQANNP